MLIKSVKERVKSYSSKRYYPHEYAEKKNNYEIFLNSQFGYCPLFWMFLSKRLNNKLNSSRE